MPINPQYGFQVYGPQRNGDKSFECEVVIMAQPTVMGGIPDVVGRAHVRVDNDKVCEFLASALRQIAEQIPPDLSIPGRVQ